VIFLHWVGAGCCLRRKIAVLTTVRRKIRFVAARATAVLLARRPRGGVLSTGWRVVHRVVGCPQFCRGR
jgi:hypothetical protein